MLSTQTQLGATNSGTTFGDIIINNISGVADGLLQGFSQFVHDPRALKNFVTAFTKTNVPNRFADAVVLRRLQTQKIDDIWNFPLNLSLPSSCPLPWTIVEATFKNAGTNAFNYEFNVMRTVDLVGRNYLLLRLPAINTHEIYGRDAVASDEIKVDDMYLGAWHRDLIPRIIKSVKFYPRSNSHVLLEYSGYDIYIHNLLFGNQHKEMNDLMSGEDKFELCYDPFRVDPTAPGARSFRGVDYVREWNVTGDASKTGYKVTKYAGDTGADLYDGITDKWQLDTTMDEREFRCIYRTNVWYEAPVARNYHCRHSIHSRRFFHQAKDIVIPLDILPFGHSIASSLPSSAIAGDCGYIAVSINENWLDRSFYLTRLSDVPVLHPLVNHVHYETDDTTPEDDLIGSAASDTRCGWVNERSLGRWADPTFVRGEGQDGADNEEAFKTGNRFVAEGGILGVTEGFTERERIPPKRFVPDVDTTKNVSVRGAKYSNIPNLRGAQVQPIHDKTTGKSGAWVGATRAGISREATNWSPLDVRVGYSTSDIDAEQARMIKRISQIDTTSHALLNNKLDVKLMQIGFQTLACIRDFLGKLPNIYISTEWADRDVDINSVQKFDINNDLYIQAVVLWWIPYDNDVESMRVYPWHLDNHEVPICPGIKLVNEQSQGTTVYSWAMLNELGPAQMNMNPLLENIGLLSFSPMLAADQFPLAYYDVNTSGYLKCEVLKSTAEESHQKIAGYCNLRSGYLKVICIGINGVASVNLGLYRLVF